LRYAGILRAINVGRHNRIRMDVLRAALEAAGHHPVRSYLQTGNLTFDSDAGDPMSVAGAVEGLLAGLGLRSASVICRPWSDIVELAALTPFTDFDPVEHSFGVTFCRMPVPDPPAGAWTERGLTFVGGPPWALFTVVRRDLDRAPNANSIVERRWGIPASTRHWHVVTDWVAREQAAHG
jgi:hypothetical protein